MSHPVRLDRATGRRVPTGPCFVLTCDREYPFRRYRYDHAVIHGWALYRVGSFASWCAHGQEFPILLDADVDYVRLVPTLGEAR